VAEEINITVHDQQVIVLGTEMDTDWQDLVINTKELSP